MTPAPVEVYLFRGSADEVGKVIRQVARVGDIEQATTGEDAEIISLPSRGRRGA
jgi:hypothetical protein